jgi:hypothetical protein
MILAIQGIRNQEILQPMVMVTESIEDFKGRSGIMDSGPYFGEYRLSQNSRGNLQT